MAGQGSLHSGVCGTCQERECSSVTNLRPLESHCHSLPLPKSGHLRSLRSKLIVASQHLTLIKAADRPSTTTHPVDGSPRNGPTILRWCHPERRQSLLSSVEGRQSALSMLLSRLSDQGWLEDCQGQLEGSREEEEDWPRRRQDWPRRRPSALSAVTPTTPVAFRLCSEGTRAQCARCFIMAFRVQVTQQVSKGALRSLVVRTRGLTDGGRGGG